MGCLSRARSRVSLFLNQVDTTIIFVSFPRGRGEERTTSQLLLETPYSFPPSTILDALLTPLLRSRRKKRRIVLEI